MKYLYFLVDCSGSVVSGDSTLVGQLNDLLRDAAERLADMAEDMFVFTYADEAELYWTYSKEQTFYDIPLDKFGGRSSLGKCYVAVVNHMATLGVDHCRRGIGACFRRRGNGQLQTCLGGT